MVVGEGAPRSFNRRFSFGVGTTFVSGATALLLHLYFLSVSLHSDQEQLRREAGCLSPV